MNYLTDIQPREADGKTDADIAAELVASHLTVRDIPVSVLRPLLTVEWGLVVVDPITQQRSGPLIDLYQADIPSNLKGGISKMLAHSQDPTAQFIRTSSKEDVAQMWAGVVILLGLSDAQRAVLESLHGGERFAGATGEQVTVLRTDYQNGLLKDEQRSRLNEARDAAQSAIDAGSTDKEVLAAFMVKWSI